MVYISPLQCIISHAVEISQLREPFYLPQQEKDDMIAYQLEEFFYANYGSRQKRKE